MKVLVKFESDLCSVCMGVSIHSLCIINYKCYEWQYKIIKLNCHVCV